MHKQDFAIGQALAYLKYNSYSKSDEDAANIPEEQRLMITMLRERINALNTHQNAAAHLKMRIPENQCDSDNLFIKNNHDLLLALFFDHNREHYCAQLGLHLNNCFRCFEYFSDVIRGYYHATKQMRNRQ